MSRPTRSLSPSSSIRRRRLRAAEGVGLRLVRLGFLRAVSVGFIPLVESPHFADEAEAAAYLARAGSSKYGNGELCELSLTIVPSNPDALKARSFTLRARWPKSPRSWCIAPTDVRSGVGGETRACIRHPPASSTRERSPPMGQHVSF